MPAELTGAKYKPAKSASENRGQVNAPHPDVHSRPRPAHAREHLERADQCRDRTTKRVRPAGDRGGEESFLDLGGAVAADEHEHDGVAGCEQAAEQQQDPADALPIADRCRGSEYGDIHSREL
jgi:hypothetical protein